MIGNKELDTFDINYIEIHWELSENKLICVNAHHKKLFNTNP